MRRQKNLMSHEKFNAFVNDFSNIIIKYYDSSKNSCDIDQLKKDFQYFNLKEQAVMSFFKTIFDPNTNWFRSIDDFNYLKEAPLLPPELNTHVSIYLKYPYHI